MDKDDRHQESYQRLSKRNGSSRNYIRKSAPFIKASRPQPLSKKFRYNDNMIMNMRTDDKEPNSSSNCFFRETSNVQSVTPVSKRTIAGYAQ